MSEFTFEIHIVTAATAFLLENLDDDVFDRQVVPDYLHEFLSNPSNALVVAVVEGRVVGMATGLTYIHPDKPRSLFINEIGVGSRYQRRGIGRRLVSAILDWGKQQGCQEAWVATEEGNVAARSLYRSTGGIEDDEQAVVFVYPLTNN